MTDRLTDREAIRRALSAAIAWEESMIDAHRGVPDGERDPAVIQARGLIADYTRVLGRYFGGRKAAVTLADILKGGSDG